MKDEMKELNQRAINCLNKLKNDNYVLYFNGKWADDAVDLASKALKNQMILDELLGQGLKIVSTNGDINDFDKYFEE